MLPDIQQLKLSQLSNQNTWLLSSDPFIPNLQIELSGFMKISFKWWWITSYNELIQTWIDFPKFRRYRMLICAIAHGTMTWSGSPLVEPFLRCSWLELLIWFHQACSRISMYAPIKRMQVPIHDRCLITLQHRWLRLLWMWLRRTFFMPIHFQDFLGFNSKCETFRYWEKSWQYQYIHVYKCHFHAPFVLLYSSFSDSNCTMGLQDLS